jgi:phospholipid transport system transporter-binding protein
VTAATLTVGGEGRGELAGDLDFSSVPDVWPAVQKFLASGDARTLSLAHVGRANSAGLVMLMEALDLARSKRGRLQLLDIPEELLDLARMSGCEGLLSAGVG